MTLLSTLKQKYTKTKDEYIYLKEMDTIKHFPSSVREWDNSIYVYNKNALPLVPHISRLAIKLIKSYFSLYHFYIERKIKIKKIRNKHRKLSSSRIYLSKGEFKHTNNKVTITLYTFNRQKSNYLLKLKKRFIKKFLSKRSLKKFLRKSIKRNIIKSPILQRKSFWIYKKIFINQKKYLKKNHNSKCVKIRIRKNVRIRNMKFLMKKLKNLKNRSLLALKKASYDKQYIIKVLDKLYKINKIKGVSRYNKRMFRYIKKFYRKLRIKYVRKIIKYIYFKQLIFINKSKFNYTYLQYLKNYLQVLFNKNVEFNFVNLKKFYLNSDILYGSIFLKIKRKRKSLFKYLTKFRDKISIRKKVILDHVLYHKINNKKRLQKSILKNLRYRDLTGFRLEANGRLTKRNTASRSISKVKYKGNLWNTESSISHISSVLLKGNLDSNLQYTNLNGKTNIGSFGLKGWVSGN